MYDDLNRFMSRGIFWELSTPDRREQFPPLYTLKVEPHNGLPSMYQIYMGCVDEYEAAIKLVGNMKNWRNLCRSKWFMEGMIEYGHEGLVNWRADMEARDKSLAKMQLLEAAERGSVQAMNKMYNIGEKTKPASSKSAQKSSKSEPTSKVVDIARGIK